MSCTDVAKVTGQRLLFLGVDTQNWAISQFGEAAQFAKQHGIDSLLLKCADGTNIWYGGMAGYRQIKAILHTAGIGCIPYTYSYGNKFNGLDSEIAIFKSFLQEDGVVCADMEAEWNGQVSWAQYLCSKMQGHSGTFLVSTWADPDLQNWQNVLKALNPCVDAYMPQQYDNYLAGCWGQFNGACLQPTLEMTQDVGANNQVAIAKAAHDQGCSAISIWHYATAAANPGLLDQILAAFPKSNQPLEEPIVSIDLSNPTVATHFTGGPDIWQCKDNKFLIGHGILGFYRRLGGDALCGLTYLGLPTSNETPVPGHPGVVYQRFERGVLAYDVAHALDNPPGSADVYLMHIDSGLGQDPRISQLQSQITDLQAQVDKLKNLPVVANLQQITTIGQRISDDVDLIKKLAQVI